MTIDENKTYDFIIIGAGIIGLATALSLFKKRPNSHILILEKEAGPGKHQTGRNSGVIHAGVYYKPGSLKAKLCKSGVQKTIDFCLEEDIGFEQCGKLIVATNAQEVENLKGLKSRAFQNNLDIVSVEKDELNEIEPNISGEKAILVKDTGIVDYGQICEKISEKLKASGVDILYNTQVFNILESETEIVAQTNHGDLKADKVIACAGLQADVIADMSNLADDFRIIPFRGEYFRLPDSYNNLTKHLIYPVPDPAYPFLGVHLTKMIGGHVTVGPNAVLSLGKENYQSNLPVLKDLWRTLKFPGFWKLMAKNMSAGIHEAKGSLSKKIYLKRCQKYCPQLKLEDLQPYPSGIRAQAVDKDGNMIEDFLIKKTKRSIHVCNAPSPAATSAFPIADMITNQIS